MAKKINCSVILKILNLIFVIFFTFYLTFNVIGKSLSGLLSLLLENCTLFLSRLLLEQNTAPFLHSLIIDGICSGVGSVLAFVPVIGCLFFFLSILQESGYLAHMSYLLDRPMKVLGLSGQAFIPLIMGFGCSVPAILSADAIQCKRQRYIAMLLIPYMSCSAKLPIYGMVASVFFRQNPVAAIAGVYLIGIIMAVLCGLFFKTAFRDSDCCAIHGADSAAAPPPAVSSGLQLAKNILNTVLSSCFGFIKKAFTIILLASIIVWFLQNFDTQLQMTDDSSHSILAHLGRLAAPLFAPLGFGDWRAVSALIVGISAKEAVISTLSILSGSSSSIALPITLSQIFTPESAFSFMVFCLLYVPCAATLTVVKKQTGSLRFSLSILLGQTLAAWVAAFMIYHSILLFSCIF